METMQLTWGERLTVELGRWERATGTKPYVLFESVAAVAEVVPNTVGNLRKLETPPTGKRARLAYVLLEVMGHEPADFHVEAEVPSHLNLARMVKSARAELERRLWVARGSNPEPAESMPLAA